MIPIILLGKEDDKTLSCALELLLGCSLIKNGEITFAKQSGLLLIDSPAVQRLDAGGGIVLFKESFCKDCAPKHLLHARCIFGTGCTAARDFVRDSGLEAVSCGGSFDTLALSSIGEQTVVTLQTDIKRLDGSVVSAGEFLLELPNHLGGQERLFCAAVLILLGYL